WSKSRQERTRVLGFEQSHPRLLEVEPLPEGEFLPLPLPTPNKESRNGIGQVFHVFLGHADGRISVYDLTTKKLLQRWQVERAPGKELAFLRSKNLSEVFPKKFDPADGWMTHNSRNALLWPVRRDSAQANFLHVGPPRLLARTVNPGADASV